MLKQVTGEIPNCSNLATTSALTAVESFCYNTKINETEKKTANHSHDKYITTPEFNKLMAEIFALRLKRANLASKSDIANFVKKADFDNKLEDVTSNKNQLNKLSKKS